MLSLSDRPVTQECAICQVQCSGEGKMAMGEKMIEDDEKATKNNYLCVEQKRFGGSGVH